MLKLESVELSYGAIQAVKGVSLSVKEGEVVTIIGANGAGKSTLLKGVVGLEPVSAGKVFINGEDCTQVPSHQRVGLGVALSPEGRGVFADQTVYENLLLGAYSIRADEDRVQQLIEREYSRFPRLKERANQMSGTLSGGEQQRVSIARALANKPPVILADEPTAPLDSERALGVMRILNNMARQAQTAIIVVTHDEKIIPTFKRIYHIRDGQTVEEQGEGRALD